MSVVKSGDTVSVHYRGTFLETGEEFDSSYNAGETLTFQVGNGQMIKGFDQGVVGMAPGETKDITIHPEEAYGFRNEEAVQEIAKTQFPDDFAFGIGTPVQGVNPDGQQITAQIISEQAETVTLDFNHPLAGKSLNFKIELVNITDS
ncbi:MAG: peptidylprolyl isomerase [Euryarchaeota archaeon]|nr:peptidylprolyl isomerase [Euryarchaeota archaeon]|tara:strand:- start:4556 stop:4996 length:441 start_codon:yes stop_codon:yes gene_type:complete